MKAFGVFPLATPDKQWIIKVFEEGAIDWKAVEPLVIYTDRAAADAERDRLDWRENGPPD